jgi:integrase/recombinase XerD
MKRITMKNSGENRTITEMFERFIKASLAKGISSRTIETYHSHFKCLSRHLNMEMSLSNLGNDEINSMIISMRASGLAHNSICSYTRVMTTFLHWCETEGFSVPSVPKLKDVETVKETYTDEELKILLKKPGKQADFCEYRNWTIINFLLNSGCRAATVRNIQNRDVLLESNQIMSRHNKNGKIQVIPLCEVMVSILRSFMSVRQGKDTDYLFCNECGQMLSENALKLAIAKYNERRGVQKTSIHLFRHTFARKYLIDCGGDAFTLQRLLGHSTLNMTKHYCAIFDADITKNFDNLSPLAQIKGGDKIRMER